MTRAHGYAKYRLDACRCYRCGFARSLYDEDRAKQITAGTWQPFVDAEPVRAHVKALMAAGIGRRRIAALAGCTDNRITELVKGKRGRMPQKRIRPALADKLLTICTNDHASGANVDATGTHRRIQALACCGWTLTGQAAQVGMTVSNYAALLDRPQVLRATADKVQALYGKLSMLPAPAGYGCTRVRNLAKAQGWFPPLAWDDETIDDPAACPVLVPPVEGSDPGADEWAIQRVAAGYSTAAGLDTATRRELARRLSFNGWAQKRIGDLLAVSTQRISQLVGGAG